MYVNDYSPLHNGLNEKHATNLERKDNLFTEVCLICMPVFVSDIDV
jgi:hypothetical protein